MARRKSRSRNAKASARGRIGSNFGKSKRSRKLDDRDDALAEQEKRIEKIKKVSASELHEQELARQPHTIVIRRGKVGKYVRALERDLRNVMSPNTAMKLKINKDNNIKDFIVTGAVLGVTNMMVLTMSDNGLQLRMMRFPQGPTLCYKVKQYSIARHIVSSQKRPVSSDSFYKRLPLVVMNGFAGQEKHLNLVQTFIQNMFPSLNVDTINLKTVKRCLMVNYNKEDDTVDIRHYAIRVVASGLTKSTKKIIKAEKLATKAVPDLSRYKDISDFFLNPGQLSDSEFEGEQQEVELPQEISPATGCGVGQATNVRLMELGPRLKLELVKIEEGIDEGEVLYHKYVEKTPAEVMELRKKAPLVKKLKKQAERDSQHRAIRRLTALKESKDREEAEFKSYMEKAARQQAAATGQSEEIENQRERDREIAMNREREEKEQEERGDEPRGKRVFKRRGYYERQEQAKIARGEDDNGYSNDARSDRDSQRPAGRGRSGGRGGMRGQGRPGGPGRSNSFGGSRDRSNGDGRLDYSRKKNSRGRN
ncbi:unnamed protein product [Auanema sp. JU1783]|nr:unnamed protein product [Auanema sp. JU1783]